MAGHHSTMHVRAAPDWLGPAARIGFAAKAAVYIIVGGLAIEVVRERASQPMSAQGAIATIAAQPFGQVLLWLTAIGLFAYSLWRFSQALFDPDGEGTGGKGIAKRIGYVASGVLHVGLAGGAVKKAIGAGSSGDAQSWTAALMAQPMGQWLVGAVGLGVGAAALVQGYRAYSASFMKQFSAELSADERKWARRAGRAGHAARAVVFAIIAYFLVYAAWTSNAQEAIGLDGALRRLARQDYGPALLATTAVGLFLYGIFMAVKARYRELPSQ